MAAEQKHHSNMSEILSNGDHSSKLEFLNFERLNYEEERTKSFVSWPVHFPVDPSRLAKAGFYYTGTEDAVVCFSCQGHVKNWTYGDIVLKKHADLYPNCDFIKNKSNNVPLLKTTSKFKAQSLTIENADINSNCSESNSVDYTKMKLESERLKTFSEKWPLSYIGTFDLAHAGFFYTGLDDKVQCPYCKGILSGWEHGNVPFEEHLKHFPWCDYLFENIMKVKKGPLWFQAASQDVCGNKKQIDCSLSSNNKFIDNNEEHRNLEDLGVHLHKDPVHSQQASLTARLRSFANWPSSAPVSKEDLAVAGFFYIDINDRTICFHCNGGLCSWEKGDDPWVEHARWFSTCNFLRLNKGIDFIKSCLAKNPSTGLKKPSTGLKKPSTGQKKTVPQQSCGIGSVESLLKKVDEAMKCNLVKYVLETDLFPSYIVRAAILLKVKQTGSSFSSIDDLCVAASSLKGEMEKESLDVKPIQVKDLNICAVPNVPEVKENIHSVPSSSVNTHEDEKSLKNGYPEKSNSLEDKSKDHSLCKICMDNEVGILFLPCGHVLVCTICAPALKYCPMCRESIKAVVRAYLN